jgi:hypothetical protein
MSLPGSGSLDTSATVNMLPHDLGRQLGAVWEQQTTPVRLTGNLARFDAPNGRIPGLPGPTPIVGSILVTWETASELDTLGLLD